MDLQQLLAMAAQAFKSGAGSSANGLDTSSIVSALTGLLHGQDGQIDLSGLISGMNAEGLMSIASSWLGDGGNASIGFDDILRLFGQDKVQGFANSLSLSQNEAVSGLQEALPQLVDKASTGGDLMQDMASQMLSGGLKSFFS